MKDVLQVHKFTVHLPNRVLILCVCDTCLSEFKDEYINAVYRYDGVILSSMICCTYCGQVIVNVNMPERKIVVIDQEPVQLNFL